MGEPVYFSNLGMAARHADSNGSTVFVDIEDEFSAPQFQSPDGAGSVNRAGYLVLEKGGVSDYEYGDGYYKAPSRPVTLSASVLKMPTSAGGMANTGHDAGLFRGFAGLKIPLGVFGALSATPSYFQIKPYAIWRR
jgi:hypothetical protein